MKKRILLVDGEVSTREAVLRALVSENYQVVPAVNTQDALDLAEGILVDLVLLNLRVLIQTGWELFEQLIRENPLLPVLIITPQAGDGMKTTRGRAKPSHRATGLLLQTVRDLLSEPAQVGLARMAQKLTEPRNSRSETLLSLQLS